jgi:hypothetical protein
MQRQTRKIQKISIAKRISLFSLRTYSLKMNARGRAIKLSNRSRVVNIVKCENEEMKRWKKLSFFFFRIFAKYFASVDSVASFATNGILWN